jgi:hypothetical protein
MISQRTWMITLVLLCCCSRPSQPDTSPATPTAPQPPTAAPPTASPLAAAPLLSGAVMSKIADDDLKTEEREANPYSETVTLKLSVTPQVKAFVTWGAKQVARLSPGSMDAEISRPRGSGPVDLEIKAEGFMPSHTRLYADRNDKIGVRLYRVEEAPGIFGYKRAAEKKVEKSVEKKK